MAISAIKIEERNRAAIIKYSEAMSELYRMIQSKTVDFPALFKNHTLPPTISKKFLQKAGIIHITPTGRIKWAYDGLPGTEIGAYIFNELNKPEIKLEYNILDGELLSASIRGINRRNRIAKEICQKIRIYL